MLNLFVTLALLAPTHAFACYAECVGSKEACQAQIEKSNRESVKSLVANKQKACVGKRAGVAESFAMSTFGAVEVSCTGHSDGCLHWIPKNEKFPLNSTSGCSDITGTSSSSKQAEAAEPLSPGASSLGGSETAAPTIEITVAHP